MEGFCKRKSGKGGVRDTSLSFIWVKRWETFLSELGRSHEKGGTERGEVDTGDA